MPTRHPARRRTGRSRPERLLARADVEHPAPLRALLRDPGREAGDPAAGSRRRDDLPGEVPGLDPVHGPAWQPGRASTRSCRDRLSAPGRPGRGSRGRRAARRPVPASPEATRSRTTRTTCSGGTSGSSRSRSDGRQVLPLRHGAVEPDPAGHHRHHPRAAPGGRVGQGRGQPDQSRLRGGVLGRAVAARADGGAGGDVDHGRRHVGAVVRTRGRSVEEQLRQQHRGAEVEVERAGPRVGRCVGELRVAGGPPAGVVDAGRRRRRGPGPARRASGRRPRRSGRPARRTPAPGPPAPGPRWPAAASRSRSATTTRTPSRASPTASSRPRPDPAPVTTASFQRSRSGMPGTVAPTGRPPTATVVGGAS